MADMADSLHGEVAGMAGPLVKRLVWLILGEVAGMADPLLKLLIWEIL